MGVEDRKESPGADEDRVAPPAHVGAAMSFGLFHSLTLMLLGFGAGIFWRELFQLTIRVIEDFR